MPIPTHRPSARCLRLLAAQRDVVDGGAGRIQALDELAAVPDDARRGPVGKLLRLDQIAQAQLPGVELQAGGGHVHQPLHHEGRHGTADPAKGAHRRLRRQHAARAPAIGGHAIGTGQEAHDLDRLQRRRPWIDRVRTDIAGHVRLEADDRPVGGEPQLGIDRLVEGLRGRDQVLQAIAGPLHRAAELARQRGDEDLLGIQGRLAAEPAADVGRNHPHAVGRQIERLAQRVANDAGNLGGGVQGQAPRPVLRQARPVLDRHRRLAMEAEATADGYGGLREVHVHVAARELAGDDDVRGGVLVQQRRAGGGGRLGIGRRRQRLVVDLDQFGGILGEIAVLGQPRQRANLEAALALLDAIEPGDAVDIDQDGRPDETEVEHRHEALAAREQLSIRAGPRKGRDGVVDTCSAT